MKRRYSKEIHIGNIAVFLSVQIDDGKHIIQQHSRRPHKRFPTQILLLSRTFTYKQDIRSGISGSENHVVSALAKSAAGTVSAHRFQLFPSQHIRNSFFGWLCGGDALPAYACVEWC